MKALNKILSLLTVAYIEPNYAKSMLNTYFESDFWQDLQSATPDEIAAFPTTLNKISKIAQITSDTTYENALNIANQVKQIILFLRNNLLELKKNEQNFSARANKMADLLTNIRIKENSRDDDVDNAIKHFKRIAENQDPYPEIDNINNLQQIIKCIEQINDRLNSSEARVGFTNRMTDCGRIASKFFVLDAIVKKRAQNQKIISEFEDGILTPVQHIPKLSLLSNEWVESFKKLATLTDNQIEIPPAVESIHRKFIRIASTLNSFVDQTEKQTKTAIIVDKLLRLLRTINIIPANSIEKSAIMAQAISNNLDESVPVSDNIHNFIIEALETDGEIACNNSENNSLSDTLSQISQVLDELQRSTVSDESQLSTNDRSNQTDTTTEQDAAVEPTTINASQDVSQEREQRQQPVSRSYRQYGYIFIGAILALTAVAVIVATVGTAAPFIAGVSAAIIGASAGTIATAAIGAVFVGVVAAAVGGFFGWIGKKISDCFSPTTSRKDIDDKGLPIIRRNDERSPLIPRNGSTASSMRTLGRAYENASDMTDDLPPRRLPRRRHRAVPSLPKTLYCDAERKKGDSLTNADLRPR